MSENNFVSDLQAPKEPKKKKKKAKPVKISSNETPEKRRGSIDRDLAPSPSPNNTDSKSSSPSNANINVNGSNASHSRNGTKPKIPPLSTDFDHEDHSEKLDVVSPLRSMEEIQPELQMERRRSRRLSIDFGLFDEKERCEANTVWLDFGAARIRHCDMLTRCVHALRYYSNLDLDSNVVDKDEFNNFFDDIYTTMLDDFLHVITFHANDLEEIHQSLFKKYQFTPCDIRNCAYTKRHFAAKQRRSTAMDEDPFIHFHIELYDSLHFWLFHLYDVGLRSTKKDIESDAAPIRISEEAICYDAVWSRMVQRIRKRKEETKYLQRYSRVKKYDLKATITSEVRQIAKKRESERLTFRDSLMVFARKHCPSTSAAASLQRLHSFVMKEKYDSNAIVDDVGDHGDESNLADVLNNKQCLTVIRQYIRDRKLST